MMRVWCLSDVSLSCTSGLSREERGIGRLKLAQRQPTSNVTRTPLSRSKGQNSTCRGRGHIVGASRTACFEDFTRGVSVYQYHRIITYLLDWGRVIFSPMFTPCTNYFWNDCVYRDGYHCTRVSRASTREICTGEYATAGTGRFAAFRAPNAMSWIANRRTTVGLSGEHFTVMLLLLLPGPYLRGLGLRDKPPPRNAHLNNFYCATLCVSALFAVDRCPSVRPSVCLSDTFVHSIQMAEDIVKLLCRSGSPIILVFWSTAPVPNSKGCPFSGDAK